MYAAHVRISAVFGLGISMQWHRHFVIHGLPCYTVFPYYFINCTILENFIGHTVCVLIFSTIFVANISHSKKNWMRYDKTCILVVM